MIPPPPAKAGGDLVTTLTKYGKRILPKIQANSKLKLLPIAHSPD